MNCSVLEECGNILVSEMQVLTMKINLFKDKTLCYIAFVVIFFSFFFIFSFLVLVKIQNDHFIHNSTKCL